MDGLRSRWIKEYDPSTFHPTLLLLLVLEERIHGCNTWFHRLWVEVSQLESLTGMTRASWREIVSKERVKLMSDYDNLLREQHGVNTEMAHCETVVKYLTKFGDFCLESFRLIEKVRKENGCDSLKKLEQAKIEERIGFVGARMSFTRDKLDEMLNRIRAQIQVSFSLVAQKDSKVNLTVAADSNRIAALAARDSETMKTITVITLVFLPSSLVTSIWSAEIFRLDDNSNWRVYVGTCVGITTTVLLIWFAYRAYRLRKRATEPEAGDMKEHMTIDKMP